MKNRITLSLFVAIALASTTYLACDDDSNAVRENLPDGGTDGGVNPGQDGGGDGAAKDCFDNPTTHFEIINACTTAAKITKNPTLPKLLPDGGLPPLQ